MELAAQMLPQLVVQVDQRFVEQHQVSWLRNGAGDRQALLLATGQLEREAFEKRFDTHKFSDVLNPLF